MSTNHNQPDLDEDEEFAKKLQEEINSEVNPAPSRTPSSPSRAVPSSSPFSASGATFAQLPNNDHSLPTVPLEDDDRNNRYMDHAPPVVFEYGEFDEVVTTSPEYSFALELARQAFVLKIIIAIDFVFALAWIALGYWYLAGSLIFAPLGFWAVYKMDRRILLMYLVWLPIAILIEFIMFWVFPFQNKVSTGFLALLICLIHACTEYITFQFFKQLPREPLQIPSSSEQNV